MFKLFTFIFASLLLLGSANAKEKDIDCLAMAIYHEARGETNAGQIAVGWVVINRTLSEKFPSSICKVVYQQNQFTWTRGKIQIYDRKAFQKAQNISYDIMSNVYEDPTHGALYFNAIGIKPGKTSKLTIKINQHYFYR